MRRKYPRVVRFDFPDGPKWAVQISWKTYLSNSTDYQWSGRENVIEYCLSNSKARACERLGRLGAWDKQCVEECSDGHERTSAGSGWYWLAHLLVLTVNLALAVSVWVS